MEVIVQALKRSDSHCVLTKKQAKSIKHFVELAHVTIYIIGSFQIIEVTYHNSLSYYVVCIIHKCSPDPTSSLPVCP